jgi:hypothetical protein
MAQHKWHKEIKAWADGAEIEYRELGWEEWVVWGVWNDNDDPHWDNDDYEFRIKPKVKITGRVASNTWLEEHEVRIEALEKIVSPQPKDEKPQYLYVSQGHDGKPDISFLDHQGCIGKIKLEVDDVGTT